MNYADFLLGFLLALTAAVLTLVGNRLMLGFQTKAKVREELRAFIRERHSETVEWVADLDLLWRSLRGPAIGVHPDATGVAARASIAERWDGDLLRRTRLVRYGHPDPDVREAAETVEDKMGPIITNSQDIDNELPEMLRPTKADRGNAVFELNDALIEARRAVYAAPRRDVPRDSNWNGRHLPTYLERAMAADARKSGSDV